MRFSIFFFLAITSSLFGAYVGNPASPGIMNVGIFSGKNPFFKCTTGYLADYISDKRYVSEQELGNKAFRHFGLHSQMATTSLIFLERLELFGMAGGTKEHPKWQKSLSWSDISAALVDFQSTYHFSWSAGAKVILLQWGQTYFTTDFTYFAIPRSQKSFFRFLNRLNLQLESEKQTFCIKEWQMSAALASRLFFLTPYAGATYLSSKLSIRGGFDIPPLYYQNKERFGYFFGLTVSISGKLHLNFERRLRDEFAYSFATIAVF
jgi:hypothetical protein